MAFPGLIRDLDDADTSRRGFMVVTVTPAEVRSDWVYVSTVTARDYAAAVGRRLRVLPRVGTSRLTEI